MADVAAGDQELAINDSGGVAAAGRLQACFALPAVGGGDIALDRCQCALGIAPSNSIEEPVAGAQAEVCPPVLHAGQVQPGVEAWVVPEGGRAGLSVQDYHQSHREKRDLLNI